MTTYGDLYRNGRCRFIITCLVSSITNYRMDNSFVLEYASIESSHAIPDLVLSSFVMSESMSLLQ